MYDLEFDLPRRQAATFRPLTPIVCWSRMQTEAGQGLEAIIQRKEAERLANGGVFCWGVGNPPAKSVARVRAAGQPVDAIFSVMKSRPKPMDVAPQRLLLWTRYFDENGIERPLPEGSIVTSRADSLKRTKIAHYALICFSDQPLVLGDYGPFDPHAYRNMSAEGGAIGASQVTALVQRHRPEDMATDYRINLRAQLTDAYWARLSGPVVLSASAKNMLQATNSTQPLPGEWRAFANFLRTGSEVACRGPEQLALL